MLRFPNSRFLAAGLTVAFIASAATLVLDGRLLPDPQPRDDAVTAASERDPGQGPVVGTTSPLSATAGSTNAGMADSPAFVGDGPVVDAHVDQDRVEARAYDFATLFAHGEKLFAAKFNQFDGQGRPATTGGGAARNPLGQPRFLRTSAPDANSCAGCHNDPFVGAAGDIVANVFVLAQTLDPVTLSVAPEFSNERNTLGMQGAGAIEMLAREMTTELLAQRDAAIARASATRQAVAAMLSAKDIRFGQLVAHPDGSVDTSGIAGVDSNLIVKPFHQKGVVVSLREFSNNAMNHHHGMQAVERFGLARTGSMDFDQDGVTDELTVGDQTAVTVYQAALATPGQVFPDGNAKRRAVLRGERLFAALDCSGCHRPSLPLRSAQFVEPNPFNPPGNLRPEDVSRSYGFDLTRTGQLPRLEGNGSGGAIVRAYTDLKRHDLCDEQVRHYCNEQLVQAGAPTTQFLTRKLWDVGNSAPYGHRGDLTTLTEAIVAHGGEARGTRDAFLALPVDEHAALIEFLKSLQMLPPGTRSLVVDARYRPLNKQALARSLGE